MSSQRLIAIREVCSRTGISKATVHRRIKDGTFPKQVSLGVNCVRWVEAEVNEWVEKRISERK